VKQVILIYTGDTQSSLQPQTSMEQGQTLLKRGGLSALTGAIFAYEQAITAMTRQRVRDSGGDVAKVEANATAGILGAHPYLLLDYGNWERGDDPPGLPWVALQLRMYRDLHYSAVASLRQLRLPLATAKKYAGGGLPPLVCSIAAPGAALPTAPVITREMHGARWGVAAIPLPAKDGPDDAVLMEKYIDQAAAALQQAQCRFGILLCKGWPKAMYNKLKADKRFTVVIGVAPPALAEPVGFGKVRPEGPVMLPELAWGGVEFGTCHLIYPTGGDAPTEFNFEMHPVVDKDEATLPYRRQVDAAIAERKKLLR
jgi:hypothetical protein